MRNTRTKLALFSAALVARRITGVQIFQGSRNVHAVGVDQQVQLVQDALHSDWVVSPVLNTTSDAIRNVSVARQANALLAASARLVQPTLLQYFMAFTPNHSQVRLLRNSSGQQALGTTESLLLDAIDSESTALFEEWHSLEHQSVESATRLAKMAALSANFSSSTFVEQIAMQSASILQMMRALELAAASKNGKAGPSLAFPQVHVASRRGIAGPENRAQALPAKLDASSEVAFGSWAMAQLSVGTMRLYLTLTCLCVVVLSAVLTVNRKTSTAAGKLKMSKMPVVSLQKSRSLDVGGHELDQAGGKALSVWDCTVATFSSIVGTGLLAMPYAFSLAGLVAVPVMLFFVACSAYTAHLMAWSLEATKERDSQRGLRPAMRGWPSLVEVAFGRRAKTAINAFLVVELWGYMLGSVVCTAMNVVQVADDLSTSAAVSFAVCVTYTLTFMPMRLLTKINVLSNVFFMACCVMFVVTGLLLPVKAPANDIKWINPHGLISAAGLLVYSPVGHSFYPSLMQRMEDPAKFPICLRRAYIGAVVIYAVVAIPGYLLFGSAMQPSVVQNIGADLHLQPIPHLSWMNTLAACGMVIKMLATQSLVLTPLTSTLEGILVGYLSDYSVSLLVAPVVLSVSAGVAVHFATESAMLLNLIGSVFCMTIAFVVPVLCYWKLLREPVGWLRRLVFISLVLLGGTFAVLGVITAL